MERRGPPGTRRGTRGKRMREKGPSSFIPFSPRRGGGDSLGWRDFCGCSAPTTAPSPPPPLPRWGEGRDGPRRRAPGDSAARVGADVLKHERSTGCATPKRRRSTRRQATARPWHGLRLCRGRLPCQGGYTPPPRLGEKRQFPVPRPARRSIPRHAAGLFFGSRFPVPRSQFPVPSSRLHFLRYAYAL